MSIAGIAIIRLDALPVDLGRAEATTLEGSIGKTLTIANVALIPQTIKGAHLDLGMHICGTGGVGRVTGALQTLGAMLWEDLTIATRHKGADHALQFVGAFIDCRLIQITGAATNGVSIWWEGGSHRYLSIYSIINYYSIILTQHTCVAQGDAVVAILGQNVHWICGATFFLLRSALHAALCKGKVREFWM